MKQKNSTSRKSDCIAFFNKLLFDSDGKNELCHLCLLIVDDPIRHARQVHAKLPLFQCPCCSFYSTWNEVEVGVHLIVAHDDPPHCVPVDNSCVYAAPLQDWMNKCYGWTESLTAGVTDPHSVSSSDLMIANSPSIETVKVESSQVVFTSDSTGFPCFSRLRHWEWEEGVIGPEAANRPSVFSPVIKQEAGSVAKVSKIVERAASRRRPPSSNANAVTCRLCNITRSCNRTALVHLYRTHLNISTLFGCRLCPFTHSCDRIAAQQHAMKEHHTKSAVTSREDEFKDRIEYLKARCFGKAEGRPKSGTKSAVAAREYELKRRIESLRAEYFGEVMASGTLSPPDIAQKGVEHPQGNIDQRVLARQTFMAQSAASKTAELLIDLTSSPGSPPSLPSAEGSPGHFKQLSPPNIPSYGFNSATSIDHEVENKVGLNQFHQTVNSEHAVAHLYNEPVGVHEPFKYKHRSAPFPVIQWTAHGWMSR